MIRGIADGVALLAFAAAIVGVAAYLGAPFPATVPRLAPYVIAGSALGGVLASAGHLALLWYGRAPTPLWGWVQLALVGVVVAAWLGWNVDFVGSAGKFG